MYTNKRFEFPEYQEQSPTTLKDELTANNSFESQQEGKSPRTNSNQNGATTKELTNSTGDNSFCDMDTAQSELQEPNQAESDEPGISFGEAVDNATTNISNMLLGDDIHDHAIGSEGENYYSVNDTKSSTGELPHSREHIVIQENYPPQMSTSFEEDYEKIFPSFNILAFNTNQSGSKEVNSENNSLNSSILGNFSDVFSDLPCGDSSGFCSVNDLLQMAESNWGLPLAGLEDIVTMCSSTKVDDYSNVWLHQSHEMLSDTFPYTNKSSSETPPQPNEIKEVMDYTNHPRRTNN
ncbi:hypothetical protein Fcan01_08841 [Folsomia candida]|uniref:Uncharacterized protein n=1 Tax=Folsomia candida TaxID=158441 RepID=A0A226EF00_FOLCA|nr:hypothetical protein Fcan01_08841 [Folsomia candida]